MFKKGNKHGCREVKKDQYIKIRVTAKEKEDIQNAANMAANGNISGYIVRLHKEYITIR